MKFITCKTTEEQFDELSCLYPILGDHEEFVMYRHDYEELLADGCDLVHPVN